MTDTSSGLRADAARNRTRILRAAQELYAVRGLDVTLDDVAEHAGVGVATVYRRFGDRNALVEALFCERLDAQADIARACLADADPWRSFVTLFESTCQNLAADKGLRQVLLSSVYGQEGITEARRRLIVLVDQVLRRAQDADVVRPDLLVTDLPALFLGIGSVADFGGTISPDLWRRFFDIVLEGIRHGTGRPPLRPGLTAPEFDRLIAAYRPAHPARTHPLPASRG